MTATYANPAWARYRESITELIEAGEPFDAVEDAIDDDVDLAQDAKAALWLLAFVLRDRGEQARVTGPYVASISRGGST